MIIHYIQLRIISKRLKLCWRRTLNFLTRVVLWESQGPTSRKMPSLNNKDIANEYIELGYKTLHAEDEQKLLGIIIDKNLNF